MKLNKSIIISVAIIIISLIAFIIATGYKTNDPWMAQPRFFPMLVTGLTIFFSLIVIIEEYKKDKAIIPKKYRFKTLITNVKVTVIQNKKIISAMIVSLLYVTSMETVGFPIGTTLFLLGILTIIEPSMKKIPRTLLTSIIYTAIIFYIFTMFFNARFPMGFLG